MLSLALAVQAFMQQNPLDKSTQRDRLQYLMILGNPHLIPCLAPIMLQTNWDLMGFSHLAR